MINFLACTRVGSGLPGGYCCVLYPLLVIHHLGTVSATASHSHMQRERGVGGGRANSANKVYFYDVEKSSANNSQMTETVNLFSIQKNCDRFDALICYMKERLK